MNRDILEQNFSFVVSSSVAIHVLALMTYPSSSAEEEV